MFWAECSNLQAWAESNCDARLISFKLAFTLLKELKNKGDSLAERVLKEEIAKAFEIGNSYEISYLVLNYFLDYLNREELEVVFKNFEINHVGNQILLIKIKLFDKIHQLSDSQERILLETRMKKEIASPSKQELTELFAETFSSFAIEYAKEKSSKKTIKDD